MEEKEEIEILTQKLIKEIESNPEECISIFKKELLGDKTNSMTYEEYLNQLEKTLKKCTCQASFQKNQILIHCLDCQKNKNSCICVNCFLKGKHQGHRIYITHSSSATCDCGDSLFWSPSGFCPDHPGPESNPEQTQLSKETRIKLLSISKASLSNYITYITTKSPLFMQITEFLFNLVSIGDATRRCVCLAIKDTLSFYELYTSSINLEPQEMEKLIDFLGSLTNDLIFRDYFSLSFLSDLPKFINFNDSLKNMNKNEKESANKLYSFTFHAGSFPIVCELIKNNLFNWSDVFKKSFNLLLELNLSKPSKEYSNETLFINSIYRIITILRSAFSVFDSKSPEIIELIDQIAEILIKNEFCFKLSRVFGEKLNDPTFTQRAVFHVYFSIYQYVNKIISKSVPTKKPLFLLEKFFKSEVFQSIDESYVPVDDSDSDFHFHSVLDENVEFSQSFATHILAFYCINFRDKKTFSETLKEVTDDVEKFLRDWTVIPLRWLAASELSEFRFFVRNSQDTVVALDSFNFKKNIKYKFVPTFSLIQQLLKTTENVDDFLLMIISTFGFFNSVRNEEVEDETRKLDDNQNRNLLLIIYNFVLCLIFDTLCIERNFFMMMRISVISMLMNGDLTTEQINSIWFKKVLNDENFCDDLPSFASKVTNQKGTKYHLKDSSEWHPLLPFLSLPTIIPLVQKFVDEKPDSLINFPSIPNDSIHLLFSPTLWALHYYILSQKCCKDYQVIQQFVFNTLIVTSQNSEKFYKDKNTSQNSEINSVLNVGGFCDLAFQLKKFAFKDFLTVKVVFSKSDSEPKSMVDLISVFGNLGITVLTRLNLTNVGENSVDENQQKKEEMKKKNKERAKQLKMQIMSNFNKKQKSFQTSSSLPENEKDENENEKKDDEDDIENSSKMECSICHLDNDKDCFVYPALIYKNPLQSYIKWRFRKAEIGHEFVENFSEIPESFETFNCVRICLHPIHSQCIQKKKFSCPSDRCPRNASMPILAGFFDENSKLDQKTIFQARIFLKKAYNNDFKFALFSFASQIEILEMRHRSNPGCLDDKVIQTTLRNIYLCIWHVMRKKASEVIVFEDIRIAKWRKKTDSKYQKRFDNLKKKLSSLKDQSIFDDENDDDLKNGEFEFYINEKGSKVKRKAILFTPLMFYIASFLIEKNVNFDTYLSDDFIFDFKDQLGNDYKWLQFLRCAAIFDHFARECKITQKENENSGTSSEFIDWDVILSPSNLCKHYNVHKAFNSKNTHTKTANKRDNSNDGTKIDNKNESVNTNNNNNANDGESVNANNVNNGDGVNSNIGEIVNTKNNGDGVNNEMTLPMFSLTNLPKNFLDFIHPPFSAPILEYDDCEVLLCLLTGKTVLLKAKSPESNTKNYMKLSKFLDDDFNESFSLFLKLNGDDASSVIIGDIEFNTIISLRPFYTDKFGDKDVGMKRGSLLYLNEPIIEEIIDDILSGNWTNKLHFK